MLAGWMMVAGVLAGGTLRAEEEPVDPADEETFAQADTDNDGDLTFEEATAAGLSDGSERDRAAWRRLADEKGRLRRHLFHEMCRKHRRRAAEARAGATARWKQGYVEEDGAYREERFDRADADGSDDLTRAEARAEATPLEERLFGGKRFNRADANDDGVVTRGETRRQLDRERDAYRKHKSDRPGELREMVKNKRGGGGE